MKKLLAVATMAVLLCLACMVMSGTAFAQCVDNKNGTVTDNGTGLMWQEGTSGPMNWDAAMSYASSLSLGGHSDWWLPSKDVLQMLYHSPCKSIIKVVRSVYWSSTTARPGTTYAEYVHFYNGLFGRTLKSENYYVRAVRAGQ